MKASWQCILYGKVLYWYINVHLLLIVCCDKIKSYMFVLWCISSDCVVLLVLAPRKNESSAIEKLHVRMNVVWKTSLPERVQICFYCFTSTTACKCIRLNDKPVYCFICECSLYQSSLVSTFLFFTISERLPCYKQMIYWGKSSSWMQ